MKKLFFVSLLFLSVLACNSSQKNSNPDKKTLTVTIEPQRFFLERIVSNDYQINVLVPPGTSPETYEPAPSVMLEMNKSDIYFMVGDLGFENAWSERLAENNPQITVVNCSENINRLPTMKHEDAHAHKHGDIDPHIWTSPNAARVLAKNMLDALITAYPENAEVFLNNFNELSQLINETDSVIEATFANSPTRAFIIYHPALGYFAQEYGLHQHSIESEGKSPSPAQIKALVDLSRQENITTIFVQKGFDVKNAEVVATEIGAEVFEINPLAPDWDKELIRIAQILARPSNE